MADYFTATSVLIHCHNNEQKAWWIDLRTGAFDWFTKKNQNLAAVDMHIHTDPDSNDVCLFSINNYADVGFYTICIQKFLEAFDRDDLITFRWAETCSKPRPNSFGGGVYAVSRKFSYALNISSVEESIKRIYEATGDLPLSVSVEDLTA